MQRIIIIATLATPSLACQRLTYVIEHDPNKYTDTSMPNGTTSTTLDLPSHSTSGTDSFAPSESDLSNTESTEATAITTGNELDTNTESISSSEMTSPSSESGEMDETTGGDPTEEACKALPAPSDECRPDLDPNTSLLIDTDLCDNDCTLPKCNDGHFNSKASSVETCEGDLPILPEETTCREDCFFCGDGIVQQDHEKCDPTQMPNMVQNCRKDCTYCGDGIVDESDGEMCDGVPPCNKDCKNPCGDGLLDLEAGEECDDGIYNSDPTNNNHTYCSSNCKRLGLIAFVTSGIYSGNLGGKENANTTCTQLASEIQETAPLNPPRKFRAWLSTKEDNNKVTSPKDDPFLKANMCNRAYFAPRLPFTARYRITSSLANSIQSPYPQLESPINTEEHGLWILLVTSVLTATDPNGTMDDELQDCNEWNGQNNGEVRYGISTAVDSQWTSHPNKGKCELSQYRLYCFEQCF